MINQSKNHGHDNNCTKCPFRPARNKIKNTKANGKGKSYKNKAKIKLTKNITLYAQWKLTKYKITYKLNGGKNAKKNPTAYTYKTSTIKLKNPTRKGYVFKGWYLDKKFKKKVTVINKGSSGNKTLYDGPYRTIDFTRCKI